MVIMEENKGYSATIGSCGADPYICSLAASYTSVTNWSGTGHPSQPNYTAIGSGSMQGCTADDCVGAGAYSVNNLGNQLTVKGVPWTAYMESMPNNCYTGNSSGAYVLKHNPFVYYADNLPPAVCNILPYPGVSSMVSNLTGANAPDFVWITPNLNDDMHDGSVASGDAWLKTNLAPVLASSWFTNFNSTVIITMDENTGDNSGAGGGHIPLVVISSNAKGHGSIALTGNHYGALRSVEEAYGLSLLGAASNSANGDLTSLFG
jgi:acid phosphatase